ncbi:MAG: 1,4-dihydroxy-6-naphthoate synthase [Leptospiraceae bacterium]|nr:1,4-dihydroxy-6-naphthoate synthase [Leptospiraceae bacterium]MCZ8346255.1 1,4-dihydroxy-6-naphthoate synthase [Leptospiraceae bacterium]
MKESRFTLAYSPCPNDTFIFYNLIHSNLNPKIQIVEELKDVEELNQSALIGRYDITKLSFSAYFQVADIYEILDSGSALGRGCGPLLIRRKGTDFTIANAKSILSPGSMTTANLLLQLYAGNSSLPLQYKRYDKIIHELSNGKADLGVIIHEERFTYQDFGLEVVADLGEWWEKTTSYPIPLGCIAIKRSLGKETKEQIDHLIKKSLQLAWQNPKEAKDYILANSQNKNLDVVQSHIDLYVNSFSESLGKEGHEAIQDLEARYRKLNKL